MSSHPFHVRTGTIGFSKWCVLVVAINLLVACTGVNSYFSAAQRYEQAMEAHRYQRAINIAEQQIKKQGKKMSKQLNGDADAELSIDISDGVQQWSQNLLRAWDASMDYQTAELKQIEALMGQNNWVEVDERRLFLSNHLPGNPELERSLEHSNDIQQRAIETNRRELLAHEAVALPKTLSLYDQLHSVDPSNRAVSAWRKRLMERRDLLAEQLASEFSQAEQGGDLQYALATGRQLHALTPSEELATRLAVIESQLARVVDAASKRAKSQREALRLTNEKAMLDRYEKALEAEEWLEAKLMIGEILRHKPEDEQWQYRQALFQQKLDAIVNSARQEGEKMYAEGNIEKALETWQEVLPLASDDDKLKANIERAQRILNKIDLLKAADTELPAGS